MPTGLGKTIRGTFSARGNVLNTPLAKASFPLFSRVFWRLSSILLIAFCFSEHTAHAADGVESRCTQLGTSCLCSEPMDTTDTFFNAGTESHNFTDSPPATECSKFGVYFSTDGPANDFTTPPAVGAIATPGGGVGNVVQAVGGHVIWLTPRQFAATSDQRLCMRYYKRVSNDFSGAGYPGSGCASERNKVFQMAFGATRLIQIEERSDFGSGCFGPGTYKNFWIVNHADANGTPGQFTIDWDDCNESAGWCRFEMCASGNLASGQNIKIEGRITALGTGKDEIRTTSSSLWNPGTGFGGTVIGGDVFHGQGSGPIGKQYLTHFIQAAWSTNQGQWIGPACEVEGGCGGLDTIPPSPPSGLMVQ